MGGRRKCSNEVVVTAGGHTSILSPSPQKSRFCRQVVDPLSFYSSALQGWNGGSGGSQRLACGLLRLVVRGKLPPESDLRVWNVLCDAAVTSKRGGERGRDEGASRAESASRVRIERLLEMAYEVRRQGEGREGHLSS